MCISVRANTFEKGMNPPLLSSVISKIVEKTGLSSHIKAMGLEEKLRISKEELESFISFF